MERRHQGHAGPDEATGQLLVTTDHEVIRRWAGERGAEPALAKDPGDEETALRFATRRDGGEGLEKVSWEEWLDAFDRAGLRFVYADVDENGDAYRLERPDRA